MAVKTGLTASQVNRLVTTANKGSVTITKDSNGTYTFDDGVKASTSGNSKSLGNTKAESKATSGTYTKKASPKTYTNQQIANGTKNWDKTFSGVNKALAKAGANATAAQKTKLTNVVGSGKIKAAMKNAGTNAIKANSTKINNKLRKSK